MRAGIANVLRRVRPKSVMRRWLRVRIADVRVKRFRGKGAINRLPSVRHKGVFRRRQCDIRRKNCVRVSAES
jgi:hypothetical protein